MTSIQREPPYTTDAVQTYINTCVELCWYMVVQDPPVVMRRDRPSMFDTRLYREYTSRGQYVDFVVWPTLYLHEGGAVLAKGVAQGRKTAKTPTK